MFSAPSNGGNIRPRRQAHSGIGSGRLSICGIRHGGLRRVNEFIQCFVDAIAMDGHHPQLIAIHGELFS
jgi:hypothetical protein